MKSIKPGRGPSGMSFIGSIISILFGILWTILAASFTRPSSMLPFADSMGGPMDAFAVIFPLFGLLFVGLGIANAVYHYKNARGKDRFSMVDIVDGKEEGDPGERWIKDSPPAPAGRNPAGKFCTACGRRLEGGYAFCPGCGRDLTKP